MNIKGIGASNVVNLYNNNSVKRIEKTNETQHRDRIEISALAKSLKAYDVAEVSSDNRAKIQELKEKVTNGTYNVDAKVTADSIMNFIKEGRDIDDK